MKALLTCWLAAIAVLVWLAIPQPSQIERRWPALTPPAMTLEMFKAAKRAAEQPAACLWWSCRLG
jgi:hypothetical protein